MSEHPFGSIVGRVAALVGSVAVIVVAWFVGARRGGDFSGTDSSVQQMLGSEDWATWFQRLVWHPSGELESGLFALQAAIGAAVLGYVVGALHERRRAQQAPAPGHDDPTHP